jgi:multidrug efflux system membrane fusion protein
VVLVPTTAILRGPQGTYVFAVGSDNKVKIHIVSLAETNGNITGVTLGLNAGDVVVTDGQDKLQEGSKVEPRQSSVANAPGDKNAATNANSPFASPAGGPAR